MRRFSVMARQYQHAGEVELCQCDTNPEAIAAAALEQRLRVTSGPGGRRVTVPKYEHVYIVDHNAWSPARTKIEKTAA